MTARANLSTTAAAATAKSTATSGEDVAAAQMPVHTLCSNDPVLGAVGGDGVGPGVTKCHLSAALLGS